MIFTYPSTSCLALGFNDRASITSKDILLRIP
jgi:hypothetical protein